MTALYIVLGVLALAVLAVAATGFVLLHKVFHPRHFTWEQGKEHERGMGAWTEGEFESLMACGRVQRFVVEACDGVQLNAAWVLPEQESDRAVVIMHGFGCCAVNSYKYAKLFMERGYAALIYDNRNAGESGGRRTTLGYRERCDLALMVDIAREYAGGDGVVGTHGESLGGATVIMQAAMDDPPDFVVADCPFADMREQIGDLLKAMHLPVFPLVGVASFFCRIMEGFSFKEVSPVESLLEKDGLADVPVLFIDGTADSFILPKHTKRLYAAKKGEKQLWFCEGAAHARSIVKDPEGYRRELFGFLDRCGY